MTTHYMEEAEVCDKISIIDNGKIITTGTPEELKKTVGGDVIYLKTSDNKTAKSRIEELFNSEVSEKDGELFLNSFKGDSCIPELIKALGDTVQAVRLQRPTLNDVFLKMTGRRIREEDISSGDTLREDVRAHRRKFDRS